MGETRKDVKSHLKWAKTIGRLIALAIKLTLEAGILWLGPIGIFLKLLIDATLLGVSKGRDLYPLHRVLTERLPGETEKELTLRVLSLQRTRPDLLDDLRNSDLVHGPIARGSFQQLLNELEFVGQTFCTKVPLLVVISFDDDLKEIAYASLRVVSGTPVIMISPAIASLPTEQRLALFGHELAHLKFRHMPKALRVFAFAALYSARVVAVFFLNYLPGLTLVAAVVIAVRLICLAVSRRIEYYADQRGALIPGADAVALLRNSDVHRPSRKNLPWLLEDALSTHPESYNRVAALKQFARQSIPPRS